MDTEPTNHDIEAAEPVEAAPGEPANADAVGNPAASGSPADPSLPDRATGQAPGWWKNTIGVGIVAGSRRVRITEAAAIALAAVLVVGGVTLGIAIGRRGPSPTPTVAAAAAVDEPSPSPGSTPTFETSSAMPTASASPTPQPTAAVSVSCGTTAARAPTATLSALPSVSAPATPAATTTSSPAPAATTMPTATATESPSQIAHRLPGRGPVKPALYGPQLRQGNWVAIDGPAFWGDIIKTPAGYLATIWVDSVAQDHWQLCFSADLVHWATPASPAQFSTTANQRFYPFRVVTVRKGYGATNRDPVTCTSDICPYEGYPWYSPDGVSWSPGIPADAAYQPSSPCSCLWTPNLELGVNGHEVTKDGGATWVQARLPNDTDYFYDLVRLPGGKYAALAVPLPPTAPPGQTVGGELGPMFLVSGNGTTWTMGNWPGNTESDLFVYKSMLLVTDPDMPIQASTDAGQTWVQLAAAGGTPIHAARVETVGDKLAVFGYSGTGDGYNLLWLGTP